MNPIDLNGIADANTPVAGVPFDLNTLFGFQLPPEIAGFSEIAVDFLGNIFQNIGVAEAGVIIILIPLAFLMLRANFYLQLILKIGAVLAIVVVALILFGLVNF